METLNFAISITHSFRLDQLYCKDMPDTGKAIQYALKGIVCFLGAHYMSFIKSKVKKEFVWKLFDDGKDITILPTWADVMGKIIQFQIQPTLLIYQKMSPSFSPPDEHLA